LPEEPKKIRPFGSDHKKLVQHQKVCIRCFRVRRAHTQFPFSEEIGARKSVYGPTLSCQKFPKHIIQTYPKKFRPLVSEHKSWSSTRKHVSDVCGLKGITHTFQLLRR